MNAVEQKLKVEKGNKGNGEAIDLSSIPEYIETHFEGARFVADVTRDFYENDSNDSGRIMVVEHKGNFYYITIPSIDWRRDIVKDVNGDVVEVKAREIGDTNIQMSEIQIVAYPCFEYGYVKDKSPKEVANIERIQREKEIQAASNYLNRMIITGESVVGGEFELSLHPSYDNDRKIDRLLSEGMEELSKLQREFNSGKYGNKNLKTLEKEFSRLIFSILESITQQGTSLDKISFNLSNIPSRFIDFNLPQHGSLKAEDGPIGPYVQFIANKLWEDYIVPNLSKIDQDVRGEWTKIANANGFEDLESFVKSFPDMRFWIMNSFHTSHNIPVTEDGYVSENLIKHMTNLSEYFSEVIDYLCYSGGYSYGQQIYLGDHPVEDGRAFLKTIMSTSHRGNLINPDTSLKMRTLEAMAAGHTNTPDRSLVKVSTDGSEAYGFHSTARQRISINLNAFNKDLVETIAKTARFEYTSRSATPDKRKYIQSVALVEVIKIASLYAEIDGYNDIFQWLRDKVNEEHVQSSIYDEYNTQVGNENTRRSVIGELDDNKISCLENIIKYIRANAGDDVHLDFAYILDKAEESIEAIRRRNELITSEFREMNAVERFNYYVNNNIGNWGAFLNTLTDDDLVYILTQKFEFEIKQDHGRNLDRAMLLEILQNKFIQMQFCNEES